MDVLVLIDKLDDLVHNAKAVPLTDQVRIDREEIYDILDQMRATIPEEIKQARWIVKERQEMLAEAKRECDRLLGEAREQAVREASQTEIVKLAERQAQEIIDDARRQARETAARDGGLGRRDPLDARGQPRQVPRAPSSAAASGCTSARRRRSSPASGRATSTTTTSRPTSAVALPVRLSALRYAGRVTTFNLRQVKLRPGEQFRDEQEIELEPLELGGQRYVPVPEEVPAELAITRATQRLGLRARASRTRLHGPCFRCLEDAVLDVPISAREYQATSRRGADEDAQPVRRTTTSSSCRAWARDALVLALPDKILCRPDCAGLCPVCGKNLNERAARARARSPATTRWAALAELRDRL